MQGGSLSHLRALRRLTLHAPRVEALFCVMEGLPTGLEQVTISAPAGEAVVLLDRDANRLAVPLNAFRVRLSASQCVMSGWPRAAGAMRPFRPVLAMHLHGAT